MIELNFSGSSVAIGAMTSARSTRIDVELVGQVLDRVHEEDRPEDDQAERREHLEVDHPEPRHGRVDPMRGTVQPVEPQRGEILRVDVGIGLEVALDVPGIDPDQDHGHDPLEPDRLERQEGRSDGQRVGDGEVADVVGEDLRVDLHRVAGRPVARGPQHRDAGDEHGQRGEHERRPEDGPDADLVR